MQTMPSKNRPSLAVAGVAVLVLVVGLIAYGVNQRTKQETKENDTLAQLASPENGSATPRNMTEATPGQAMTNPMTAPGTTVANNPPVTGAKPEMAGAETDKSAPALNVLGPVPATHMVAPGDTLYTISMKYYKSHIYAGDIEALNALEDPDTIVVGTELKLPRPEALMPAGQ